MEDNDVYFFSKERMIKLSDYIGISIWRLDRSKFLMSAIPTVSMLAFYILFFFSLLLERCKIMYAIMYWVALGGVFLVYCTIRIRWDSMDPKKYQKESNEAILIDMDNARVRREIEMMERQQ